METPDLIMALRRNKVAKKESERTGTTSRLFANGMDDTVVPGGSVE